MSSNNNNIDKVFNNLRKNIDKKCINGAVNCARDIGKRSIAICPKDTGKLRESFTASVAGTVVCVGTKNGKLKNKSKASIQNNGKMKVELKYDCRYAIFPHERDDVGTNWTTPGTHSKYLENPVYESDLKKLFLEGFNSNNKS